MAGSSARPEGLPAAPSKERGCELWRPLPEEEVSCCGPLTAAQIDEFYADGFVLVRGLVKDGDLLRRTRDACLKTMDMDPARKEAGTGLEGSFPLLEASVLAAGLGRTLGAVLRSPPALVAQAPRSHPRLCESRHRLLPPAVRDAE